MSSRTMTPEQAVKLEIANYLDIVPGLEYWYTPTYRPARGRKRSSKREKIQLDIAGWWFNRGFYLEVKAPGHSTNKERLAKQQDFVNRAAAAGHFAAIVESLDELRVKMKSFHQSAP